MNPRQTIRITLNIGPGFDAKRQPPRLQAVNVPAVTYGAGRSLGRTPERNRQISPCHIEIRKERKTPQDVEDDETDQGDSAVEHHRERQVVPC